MRSLGHIRTHTYTQAYTEGPVWLCPCGLIITAGFVLSLPHYIDIHTQSSPHIPILCTPAQCIHINAWTRGWGGLKWKGGKRLGEREDRGKRGEEEAWKERWRWKKEQRECSAEINSTINAKLIKKKNSAKPNSFG